MCPLLTSMDATTLCRTVREFLAKYDVDLDKDVAGVTTDGASVMVKFGTMFEATQQLCFVHAVHLAVTKVLYKNYDQNENDKEESDDDNDTDDENERFDIRCEERFTGLIKDKKLKKLIGDVRKVVNLFRRSPLKNDTVLQPYIIKDHGKQLSLIIDCVTRWNTLCDMIQRFVLVKDSIKRALGPEIRHLIH